MRTRGAPLRANHATDGRMVKLEGFCFPYFGWIAVAAAAARPSARAYPLLRDSEARFGFLFYRALNGKPLHTFPDALSRRDGSSEIEEQGYTAFARRDTARQGRAAIKDLTAPV